MEQDPLREAACDTVKRDSSDLELLTTYNSSSTMLQEWTEELGCNTAPKTLGSVGTSVETIEHLRSYIPMRVLTIAHKLILPPAFMNWFVYILYSALGGKQEAWLTLCL